MPAEHVPAAVRRVVRERAGDLCEYCRSPASFATQSFTVEHIRPRAGGGQTTLENLAWACFGCNAHKHAAMKATDSQTGTLVPLYHPRRAAWSEHFQWVEGDTRVAGKTPTGRATVDALRLNRIGLVNLRQVLAAAGLHPPADGPTT